MPFRNKVCRGLRECPGPCITVIQFGNPDKIPTSQFKLSVVRVLCFNINYH